MFFSKKLVKYNNIKHCFFSRKNGVSKGIYKSLNCGIGSNDKKENVYKNLELVCEKIGCKSILEMIPAEIVHPHVEKKLISNQSSNSQTNQASIIGPM